jgi:hypothetical protein
VPIIVNNVPILINKVVENEPAPLISGVQNLRPLLKAGTEEIITEIDPNVLIIPEKPRTKEKRVSHFLQHMTTI